MKYVRLLRIKHWVKNILCFLPIFFSMQFYVFSKSKNVVFAFFSFCMASSAVYIFNDIQDRESDRKSAAKCIRPLAAGTITVKKAYNIMGFLCISMLVLNYYASDDNRNRIIMFGYLTGYILLNFFYSLWLKHIPIIDVIILASGFVIRVFYGGLSIDSGISNWVYLTVLSMAFFFSFGKRRNELRWGTDRRVLKEYPMEFLNHSIYVSLTLFIVFYCLCVTDGSVTVVKNGIDLRWTIIFVIYLCLQYSLILEKGKNGDPVEVFFTNKLLVITTCILVIGIIGQVAVISF